MDDGNFLSATEMSKLESILDESERLLLSCHFKRLHNTRIDFVLDAGELTFSVFSDDCNVHIGVSGFYLWMRETKVYIGKKIQMLIKFVIIVVFSLDPFFWDHHTKKDALVLVQGVSLFQVFKSEVSDDIELDWNVCGSEHFNHTV